MADNVDDDDKSEELCLVISVKRAETRKMESAADSAISSCGKIVFFLKKCPYLLIFCSVLIVLLFLVKK